MSQKWTCNDDWGAVGVLPRGIAPSPLAQCLSNPTREEDGWGPDTGGVWGTFEGRGGLSLGVGYDRRGG